MDSPPAATRAAIDEEIELAVLHIKHFVVAGMVVGRRAWHLRQAEASSNR
jgi:hypothetical protein